MKQRVFEERVFHPVAKPVIERDAARFENSHVVELSSRRIDFEQYLVEWLAGIGQAGIGIVLRRGDF